MVQSIILAFGITAFMIAIINAKIRASKEYKDCKLAKDTFVNLSHLLVRSINGSKMEDDHELVIELLKVFFNNKDVFEIVSEDLREVLVVFILFCRCASESEKQTVSDIYNPVASFYIYMYK